MERAAGTEDLITIGMRGDGDTPMGGKEGEDDKYVPRDEENMRLMEKIFRNQRRIIKDVTGKVPEKRPQVWAIYKEVQRFYDMGLRVPDDVIMLLSDDNWGMCADCRMQKNGNVPVAGDVLSCGLCGAPVIPNG